MHAALAVRPHDLLWGLPLAALPVDAPDWVREVIRLGHPVVVRRAQVAAGWVAVGVRGSSRDQRYATLMQLKDITRRLSPEQLVSAVDNAIQDWPALHALRQVRPVLDSLGLPWGVAGSVGFELASGVPVLHQDSDLDLILRTEDALSREQSAAWVKALDAAVCRIDLQLQTPVGAVALREWAGTSKSVLLKADDGARLVSNPWREREQVA
jgi:phosphoribosyl-dephospho-CoA transferase